MAKSLKQVRYIGTGAYGFCVDDLEPIDYKSLEDRPNGNAGHAAKLVTNC